MTIDEQEGGKCSVLDEAVQQGSLNSTPIPQVSTGGHGPPGLDFGVLVGGSSVSLPLQLTNHGLAELPLRLSISAVSTTRQRALTMSGQVSQFLVSPRADDPVPNLFLVWGDPHPPSPLLPSLPPLLPSPHPQHHSPTQTTETGT